MVKTAIMIWTATRVTERTWLITGDDLLDLEPMHSDIGPHRRNIFYPCIPTTPIMDTQLDELAIGGVLFQLGKNLLNMVHDLTRKQRKEDWYELFLTTFIIMHNYELVLEDIVDFANRNGKSVSHKLLLPDYVFAFH
jgi:hypothetical protein